MHDGLDLDHDARPNRLDVDYEQLFSTAGRVLLLWDAHGFEIAETVLGRILPVIASRPHLVLMHDTHPHAAAVVPELIASAREQGLRFAPLTEWIPARSNDQFPNDQ